MHVRVDTCTCTLHDTNFDSTRLLVDRILATKLQMHCHITQHHTQSDNESQRSNDLINDSNRSMNEIKDQ